MSPYEQIRKLTASDNVSEFESQSPALDQFLKKHAFTNMKANSAQTYVCCCANKVAGFYSLAVGSVAPENVPERIMKGQSRHDVPAIILARQAVDIQHRNTGLGTALLKNALLRTAQAADIAGIRCLLVHAKDDEARKWYSKFDFEISPTDPYQLMLLMKDLKAIVA